MDAHPIHVVNLDVVDNAEEAAKGAVLAQDFCVMVRGVGLPSAAPARARPGRTACTRPLCGRPLGRPRSAAGLTHASRPPTAAQCEQVADLELGMGKVLAEFYAKHGQQLLYSMHFL